jgi:1-deoxy-D-xylulose-5-phosphate synthase
MEKDPKIVAITAAMLEGTALAEVQKVHPGRVFDVGIAEEHAVIMAAGMAKGGLKPVVSIYSTFLQRGYDQLIHDVCLQNLPVTVCVDRAGLIGDDGKTHQGIYDIAYTRGIPNMTVAAPKDENELQHLLFTAIGSGRPFAVRYPRGAGLGVPLDPVLRNLPLGRGEILSTGSALNLLAYGSMVSVAEAAAAALRAHGVDCGVANARWVKPLDVDLLRTLLAASPRLLTLEEHLLMGGFGSAVLEAVHAAGLPPSGVFAHGIPDQFVEHGPQAYQRRHLRLDPEGVVARVAELFPGLGGPMGSAPPAPTGSRTVSEAVHWT